MSDGAFESIYAINPTIIRLAGEKAENRASEGSSASAGNGASIGNAASIGNGVRTEKVAHGEKIPPLVLALGNFDGVHLGHARLMREAVRLAEEIGAKAGMLCFDVPPADILFPVPPKHLCGLAGKLRYASELGIEYAVICPFEAVRHFSSDAFCAFLRGKCACTGIVCGYNFRFADKGAGTPEILIREFGENASVIPAVKTEDGVPISSTRIRTLIENGSVDEAAKLLGHPFEVTGKVVHGKTLGRKMGLPTLNMDFGEGDIIPRSGIYVSRCVSEGKAYKAVTNIGSRPTVDDGGKVNCETHIIDFTGDIYGETVSVELLLRIRDEKKFGSVEELKGAIEGDVRSAEEYFEKTEGKEFP